jgi:hypothetical protein
MNKATVKAYNAIPSSFKESGSIYGPAKKLTRSLLNGKSNFEF